MTIHTVNFISWKALLMISAIFVMMLMFGGSALAQDTGAARDALDVVGGNAGGSVEDSFDNLITEVVNVLAILIGAGAVIMFLVGSFRFIASGGDSSKVQSAKNTILYSIIGLAIAVLTSQIIGTVIQLVEGN